MTTENDDTHIFERDIRGDPPDDLVPDDSFWVLYEDIPAEQRDLIAQATKDISARHRLAAMVRSVSVSAQEKLRQAQQHYQVAEILIHLRSVTKRLARLEGEHNKVMSGVGPGCRHLELMRTSFWKFLALSIGIPLGIIILAAIISLAYFGQKP